MAVIHQPRFNMLLLFDDVVLLGHDPLQSVCFAAIPALVPFPYRHPFADPTRQRNSEMLDMSVLSVPLPKVSGASF